MLQFRLTTTSEVLRRAISREAERIPKADGVFDTEFRLKARSGEAVSAGALLRCFKPRPLGICHFHIFNFVFITFRFAMFDFRLVNIYDFRHLKIKLQRKPRRRGWNHLSKAPADRVECPVTPCGSGQSVLEEHVRGVRGIVKGGLVFYLL